VLGKADSDPSGDKADHILAVLTAATDPIYQLPPESDSEGDRAIYMVGQGEQPAEKTTGEIARETEELLARAAVWRQRQLAKDTMANRMTLGHLMMSLGMAHPWGYNTRSLTPGAQLDETDSQ
jgi:hypothetical protein